MSSIRNNDAREMEFSSSGGVCDGEQAGVGFMEISYLLISVLFMMLDDFFGMVSFDGV